MFSGWKNASPLFAVIVLCLAGCGGSSHPQLYPVTGELFVKGQPAAGAQVILHPLENAEAVTWNKGYPMASVSDDGSFRIESFESEQGAPPGKYKLLATWPEALGPNDDPEAPRKNRLAPQYLDASSSPWTVQVEAKSNKLARFDAP